MLLYEQNADSILKLCQMKYTNRDEIKVIILNISGIESELVYVCVCVVLSPS